MKEGQVIQSSKLRTLLERHEGVWEGTFTHMSPDGVVIDKHACRLDIKLDGNRSFDLNHILSLPFPFVDIIKGIHTLGRMVERKFMTFQVYS